MSDEPFRVDKHGNLIGPGGLVMKCVPGAPGLVVLDAAMLNKLYVIGCIAGRLQEAQQQRRQKDRIHSMRVELAVDADDLPFPLDFEALPKKPP